MRIFPSALAGLALSFALLPTAVRSASPVDAEIEALAAGAGITHWPRIQLCGYERTPPDAILGLLLKVSSSGIANARWDGACHVPARHMLVGWPDAKPPGTYVVAARALDASSMRLQILAVLPSARAESELAGGVIRKVCGQAPRGDETDGDCRQLKAARP